MAKCAGECKIQYTKIIGSGSLTDGKIVPEVPEEALKKLKMKVDQVIKKYKEEVNKWAEPVILEGCKGTATVKCTCNAKEPTAKEWEKEPEEEREIIVNIPIDSTQTYPIKADIHFKVKIVSGYCIEPKGKPIELP